MLNFFYRALNSKKGFTLIEVLVVVAIIGILVALAAPRVIARIQDARVASDEAIIKILNDAIVAIHLDDAITGGGPGETGNITWEALTEYIDQSTNDYLDGKTAGTIVSGASFTGKSGVTIATTQGDDEIWYFVYPSGAGS